MRANVIVLHPVLIDGRPTSLGILCKPLDSMAETAVLLHSVYKDVKTKACHHMV